MRVWFVGDPWPWHRQLPRGSHRWGDVEFVFDGGSGYDAVVVYGLPPGDRQFDVPKQRVVFVASEPVTVHRYDVAFLAQFGLVITTDVETPHPNRVIQQAGLPWHVGVWDSKGRFRDEPLAIEDFRRLRPKKSKLASVVTSDKAFTPEHRSRLEFVERLKEELGDEVDVFGRGIVEFADKFEVLAPYRYHIALENCSYPHYWTEKVADPFLTLTYPIYHGAPNLAEYFPAESFTPIDIQDPARALMTIRDVVASDTDRQASAALERARDLVLDEHNLFAMLARVVTELPSSGTTGTSFIRTERSFAPVISRSRIAGGVKGTLRRILPDSAYERLRRFGGSGRSRR